MPITSIRFIFFIFAVTVAYFVVPGKAQWVVLSIASAFFYLTNSLKGSAFILLSSFAVYRAAIYMDKVTEDVALQSGQDGVKDRKAIKAEGKKKKRIALAVTVLLNFGILAFFKYSKYLVTALGNSNLFANGLVRPLGISYYTFRATGYLAEVYWGRYKPEKNYFKFLLFLSFFPGIVQGPISDYDQLSVQLFTPHKFLYKNYSYGCQRIIWGFFKKLAIADILSPSIVIVFERYREMSGIACLIWAFLRSVQIYADFSGYMDIVCGLSEIWGIELRENFLRPYFSKSVSEYWRRWHMSLGDWFRKYIYYPIGTSKVCRKISGAVQKVTGLKSRLVSSTIATIVVWVFTGIWHGAEGRYIVWGLLNGVFIIGELWFGNLYRKGREIFRLRNDRFLPKLFRVVRTFTVVTLIKVIIAGPTLDRSLGFIWNIFTNIGKRPYLNEIVYPDGLTTLAAGARFLILAFGILLLTIVDLLQRKRPVRDLLQNIPSIFRGLIFVVLAVLAVVAVPRVSAREGGFMYAQF